MLLTRLDAIGDMIIWLDAAAALRSLFPPEQYSIVLAGNALWAALAADLPYFDEVIAVDTKRLVSDFRYRLGTWRLLRGRRWDLAVNPTFSRHFPYDDAVIRVCGAGERIGSRGNRSNQRVWEKWISNRWYTRLIPAADGQLMELERNAEFMRGLGAAEFRAGLPELPLRPQLPDGFTAKEYAVFVPGAGSAQRQWPVERFAELARRVREEFGLGIVICGSDGETALGRRLQELLEPFAENWIGRTSLAGLASIIRGARLLVGNESGAIHIAAAAGVEAISLTGGGHFGRFIPYKLERGSSRPLPVPLWRQMDCFGCGWRDCGSHNSGDSCAPCLNLLGVDEVWRAIRRVLSSRSGEDA